MDISVRIVVEVPLLTYIGEMQMLMSRVTVQYHESAEKL